MKLNSIALTSSLAFAAAAICTPFAFAAEEGDTTSFKSVNLHAFAWSPSTKNQTNKGPFGKKANFQYIEIEGGLNGKWGDLYAFYDIENPTNKPVEANSVKDRRYVFKVVSNFNMGTVAGLPVTFHAQIYDVADADFSDQNRVVGLGTRLNSGGFWMKPFIGLHQEAKSGIGAHSNGAMLGWVAGYNFTAGGQKMGVSSWHETEVGRDARYLSMSRDGKAVTGGSTGHNGAVTLSWKATPSITVAGSYRYAKNKLGSATYQDGYILSAKYAF